jgi:hypothetical protein
VLFANPGGDADVVIQEWLARHSSPKRVTLVSSDRVLQRAARSCRAKFVGSEEFLQELESRRAPRGRVGLSRGGSKRAAESNDAKPAGLLSASQTAYWLGVFGDFEVAVDENETNVSSPSTQTAANSKPAERASPSTPPSRKSRSRDPKPIGKEVVDESKYWVQVFGDLSADSLGPSSEELRLADLENWLKEFQA